MLNEKKESFWRNPYKIGSIAVGILLIGIISYFIAPYLIIDPSTINHIPCDGILIQNKNDAHCYSSTGDFQLKHNATGWWKA